MKDRHLPAWFMKLKEKPHPRRACSLFIVRWIAFLAFVGFSGSAPAAQDAGVEPQAKDTQNCDALAELNLEATPGGPAFITSAHIIEVPATGLEHFLFTQSGYGSLTPERASHIRAYCNVTGYVAPQNKFVLKLPLPADWNQKFFFYACGGFCGTLFIDAPNIGLARGYASATGNGGHESALGFDGVWAANAPELQQDFGWRSNHVVTLVTKAIATEFYKVPIKYSYMVGNSKGGQAVLLEAQRFPEDFDGLMPSAPVYDYTGRNVLAGAWFAQAISNGHGGSVLNAEAAQAVHKSVLKLCGAQAGVEEGLVTDPPSCNWQPDMIACAQGSSGSDCLNARQVDAVKRLMTPVTNSKGEVLYAYPYIPGTETQWAGWNYFGAPRAGYTPRTANLELPVQHEKYLADEKIRDNVDALKYDFRSRACDPGSIAENLRRVVV